MNDSEPAPSSSLSPRRGRAVDLPVAVAAAEEYRALLAQVADGVALVDPMDGGRIVVANARLAELTGYAVADLTAMAAADLLGDAIAAPAADRVERSSRRAIRRRDGSVLVAEIGVRRVGRRLQAVVRDLGGAPHRADHEGAGPRPEGLGLVAGSVVHDFANLLLAIQANVELALDEVGAAAPGGRAGSSLRAELEDIQRVAGRAVALARQLLGVGHERPCAASTVRLADLVAGIAPILRPLLRPAELVVVGAAADGCVRGDPAQLERVLMNLAVNARDAMPGGGRVTIELASRRLAVPVCAGVLGEAIAAGDYMVLAVTDTGVGMAPATAARAFEPHFTTRSGVGGTGLGLWAVRAIVAEAAGHVTVETAPGAGSRFEVWLPEAPPPMPAATPARGAAD